MERISVSSTNIVSIGYDVANQILEIEFNSGDVFQYYNVPEGIYESLMSSNSHGSFFHQNIRNEFQYQKM